ncbi:MAG: CPBP family intramembrane metalloprotease, partial [Bradyrhizobiaceae bacterium]|nr:CPBP family intramembrane metalloprotease [Bradyrhizobiaceae bacterium]
ISDAEARQLLVYELIAFVALAAFLWLRGWTLKRIGFAPDLSATIEGFGLGLVYLVTSGVLQLMVIGMAPQVEEAMPRFSASELSLTGTIAISLFNPLFEEAFVSGYIVSALKDRYGLWTSVNVSAGIRLLYHLYQGVAGVLAIVPMGLIFAHWYARRENLWPLIVAHGCLDLYGLLAAGAG